MLRITKPYIIKQLISRILQLVEVEIGEVIITGLYEKMDLWIHQFKEEYNCKVSPDAILKCVNWQYLAIPIAAG